MNCLKLLSAIIVIIIMLNLISCDQVHFHTGNPQNHGSGDTTPNDEQTEQPITYVYSIIQKVLHLPHCSYIDDMNEEYKFTYSGDISLLLEKGYTICKVCLMEKEPEEEKNPVPDEDEVSADQATFVVNRANFKIHNLDCRHINDMSEENIKYTCLTLEELLEKEHIPCGTCLPDEYEAYKEAHPEEFEK